VHHRFAFASVLSGDGVDRPMRSLTQTRRSVVDRLRQERGFALVLVIGITVVLSIAVTTAMYYTSANSRSSARSSADQKASALAEAAMNNAISVLNDPNANALQQGTLPSTEATASSQAYGNSTAYWWGTLNGTTWSIWGKGVVVNPTGPGSPSVVRTVRSTVAVTSSLTQPLNNQSWNYIYSTKTGDPDGCDQKLANNVVVKAPMYVAGNLCLNNNAAIEKAGTPPTPEPMINLAVKGSVSLGPNSYIGTSGAKINQAYIGVGCNGHSPCLWNGAGDAVFANSVGTTVPTVSPPTADFAYWYSNAAPGPANPCTTRTGTPPVFENEVAAPTRNSSVGTVNLTPAASYTCQSGSGQLSWNASTHTLTVAGAIFIDGNATVGDGSVAQYNGQASIYVNGALSFGSNKLCGGVSGLACDFNAWNPNTEMLIFVVNGTAGGTTDYGITLGNNAQFQGGLFATHTVLVDNNSTTDGPMVAASFDMMNNMTAKPFPVINTVPVGTPGNPNVHAQPQPPTDFSG
jgi:Tfp pilus assembly protein PilX